MTMRKALYIAQCGSIDDHHYIDSTIVIMPQNPLAKLSIGHTAFDDATAKMTILATLHTILIALTLWKSREVILFGELVLSVTSLIATWGSVSILRRLRASKLRPLSQCSYINRSGRLIQLWHACYKIQCALHTITRIIWPGCGSLLCQALINVGSSISESQA